MSTPLHRAIHRDQSTPASGRRTHVTKTSQVACSASKSGLQHPSADTSFSVLLQSGLTPNNDRAELASNRRKRRSEALRKSLSDAFAGEQQDAAKPTLSPEALNSMFERCIKLAAENKITDKNVWNLELIQHLPSIVLAGQKASTSAFNFQKISGGLDAGVTIYSKRVDHTYKEAFQTLQGKGPSKDYDNEDAGMEDDGKEEVEDAAGAAEKQAKQQAAATKRSKHGAAREEATLATAEQLKQKKVDTTFAVDPLFHKMSALFDEGGAKGLLLLNRSVYRGASIMTNPHDIPEQQFLLQVPAQPDVLMDLKPLRQQLAACQDHRSAAEDTSLTLTPDLYKLHELLEQAHQQKPGQQQPVPNGNSSSIDVAAIMAHATRGLPPTPMPNSHLHTSRTANSAAAEASGPDNMDCSTEWQGASGQPEAGGADGVDGTEAPELDVMAGSSVMDDFLAATAGPEDEPAHAHDDDGVFEGDDHPGFGDEGDVSEAAEQHSNRRQSLGMLGLNGFREDIDGEVLDAEALQDLIGGSSFGRAGSKYRAKAAAIARMSGTAATAKKSATTTARGKRKAPLRLDFNNIPELPEFVQGTRKQTCLAKTASKTAVKQLPQQQQYQVASLARLSLRPTAISALRLLHSSRSAAPADSAAEDSAEMFGGGDDDGGAGWGGYEDDGDFSSAAAGAEGYNAGDLSMGDPGYSAAAAAGYGSEDEGAGDWWNADGELLNAPKRAAGLGINYNRSAKQVDIRALKDLIWDSLVTVNQHAAEQQDNQPADLEAPAEAAEAAPGIPFQDVIVAVPEESDAGDLSDVSVHMCFICLLHLANEKGLVIQAQEDLKTLTISNVQGV